MLDPNLYKNNSFTLQPNTFTLPQNIQVANINQDYLGPELFRFTS